MRIRTESRRAGGAGGASADSCTLKRARASATSDDGDAEGRPDGEDLAPTAPIPIEVEDAALTHDGSWNRLPRTASVVAPRA